MTDFSKMTNIQMFEHDERVFRGYLNIWNVNVRDFKLFILDCGMGDHYAFKNILPELRVRHENITIAACFPDVFWDELGINIISIADAKRMIDIDSHNIYKNMIDWRWNKNIVEAFKKLYLS